MRRALVALATAVVAVAAVIGLLLFVSGRDKSEVDDGGGGGTGGGPGQLLPDGGAEHLAASAANPHYATSPPASGAHHVRPVTRDQATLTDDQLLTALEAGDVVFLYSQAQAPAELRALQQRVAGAFSPELAREGQAVILARRPGVSGVIGLAWRRKLAATSPSDPRLSQFADYWLGAGADG